MTALGELPYRRAIRRVGHLGRTSVRYEIVLFGAGACCAPRAARRELAPHERELASRLAGLPT